MRRVAPEDDSPERTGESEQDYRSGCTRKAAQQNGLAADVVGKTIPVKHGDSFRGIMKGHL
jgi:hypothetical protein